MRIAIILTGGLGSRMAPITNTLNKGLIPIDGQPTLVKIISQLDCVEIDKVLVLTGYLDWQIEHIIGSIKGTTKANIVLSNSPIEFSPAQRLLQCSHLWAFASEVVLIYCDNLMNLGDIKKHLNKVNSNAVIVEPRENGNICINESNFVSYFKKRDGSSKFVELGYWRLNPITVLNLLHKYGDLQVALEIYCETENVLASIIKDYRSLSDLNRYARLRIKNRRTILIDRDGILVRSIAKGAYLAQTKQVVFLEDNIEFLSFLSNEFDVDYIVATNQAGVERNLVSKAEVDAINQYIAVNLLGEGIPIIAFYVCPHHWESKCECRKPEPGLLKKAVDDFLLDPAECIFIGDQKSDVSAGMNAGIKTFQIQEHLLRAEKLKVFNEITNVLKIITSGYDK